MGSEKPVLYFDTHPSEVRKDRWLREHASDHEEGTDMTKSPDQNMDVPSQKRDLMWLEETDDHHSKYWSKRLCSSIQSRLEVRKDR